MELYEKLKAEISLDNIYKDMAYLIDEVGERLSGSKEMEKATEYICKRLNENIGEGRIDHFPMYMRKESACAGCQSRPCGAVPVLPSHNRCGLYARRMPAQLCVCQSKGPSHLQRLHHRISYG